MQHSYKAALFYLSALLFINANCGFNSNSNKKIKKAKLEKNPTNNGTDQSDDLDKDKAHKKSEQDEHKNGLPEEDTNSIALKEQQIELNKQQEANEQKQKTNEQKQKANEQKQKEIQEKKKELEEKKKELENSMGSSHEKNKELEEIRKQIDELAQKKEVLVQENEALAQEKKALVKRNNELEKNSKNQQKELDEIYKPKKERLTKLCKAKVLPYNVKEVKQYTHYLLKNKDKKYYNQGALDKLLTKLAIKDDQEDISKIEEVTKNLNHIHSKLSDWGLRLPYYQLVELIDQLDVYKPNKMSDAYLLGFIEICREVGKSLPKHSSAYKELYQILVDFINTVQIFLIENIEIIIEKKSAEKNKENKALSANKKKLYHTLGNIRKEWINTRNKWLEERG